MPSNPMRQNMGGHSRAVARQMLNEPDGSPLGPADQSCEPTLAVDRKVLSDLAITEPASFQAIVEKVKAALPAAA